MATRPEWAQKVTELRKSLGLRQVDFAAKFSVTQAAISRWETGIKEPSTENYLKMGNIASRPSCFWFWERAGVDLTRIQSTEQEPSDRT
jgi:DNA-binding transcriptional regulator YiaG